MSAMITASAAIMTLSGQPEVAPSGQALDEVVVVAGKPVVGDLQKGTLAYRPGFFTAVRPSTALDMIAWLPGFIFEDTRDMRGLEGSTGNVLIDGKPPTSKTDTLTSVLRRIPSDQVERVDLIVGGAPGIDMHGRSVIANVVLKARDRPARVLTGATFVDSHGRVTPDLQYTTSDKSNGRQLDAAIEIQRNIAIFPTFGYGLWTRRDGTGAVLFSANESFDYDGPAVTGSASYEFPAAGGRLRLSGLGKFYGQYLVEEDRLTTTTGRYFFHEKNVYRQGEGGAHFERDFGRTTLEAQALERWTGHEVFDNVQRPPEPQTDATSGHEQETILRGVLRFKKHEALALEASAENAWNEVLTATTATQNGAPVVLPVGNVLVRERRTEAGASVTWKPNGKFSLVAALKGEDSQLTASGDATLTKHHAYAKPRLALTWSPDKDTQVRLRAEHEVDQIPFGAFVTSNEYTTGQLRAGNPDLLPSRAWVTEAVLERKFWNGGDVSLTARNQVLKDVIDVAPGFTGGAPAFEVTANIGDGRETDLIASVTMPLKRFGLANTTMRGGLTLRNISETDPATGLRRFDSNASAVQAELHVAQDFPQWKSNWGLDAFYRGPSTIYRPFGDEALAGWTHINVFAEHRFEGGLNLRIEVQNLPGAAPRLITFAYQGLKDKSPLLYTDDHRLSVGPLVYLRLRRSFE